MSNAEQLQPGDRLGRYRVVRMLGQGGMGIVYLAEDGKSQVAIKVLRPEILRKNPDFEEKFLREGRLASRINHPNVVTVLDAQSDPKAGLCYLVMEYVNGGSAHDLLLRGEQIDWEWAFAIALSVANALEVAASLGIVHRDIKPENIMLTRDGVVKLADLGIARTVDEERGSRIQGTPAYISPEQTRSDGKEDFRSDVYSLGATLFELLVRRVPFPARDTREAIAMARSAPSPDPRKLNPEIPRAAARLVMRMMSKDPAKRCTSLQQLIAEFRKLLRMDQSPKGFYSPGPIESLLRSLESYNLLDTHNCFYIKTAAGLFLVLLAVNYYPLSAVKVPELPATQLNEAETSYRRFARRERENTLSRRDALQQQLLRHRAVAGVPPQTLFLKNLLGDHDLASSALWLNGGIRLPEVSACLDWLKTLPLDGPPESEYAEQAGWLLDRHKVQMNPELGRRLLSQSVQGSLEERLQTTWVLKILLNSRVFRSSLANPQGQLSVEWDKLPAEQKQDRTRLDDVRKIRLMLTESGF